MPLRSGIPTLADVDALLNTGVFREHREFNRRFLLAHGRSMKRYARRELIRLPLHWSRRRARSFSLPPFFGNLVERQHWSRRWEYPFAAEHLIEYAHQIDGRPLRILDAGSGVTYLSYYVSERLPTARVTCCDCDGGYEHLVNEISRARGNDRVRFVAGTLQKIPLADGSMDAVCCVSVLEHTHGYEQVVSEFARVVAPDGLLVLTFDIGLDQFPIAPDACARLLDALRERFTPLDGADWHAELRRIDQPAGLLTTQAVRHTHPHLLPWQWPMAQAAFDYYRGYGWTGGFRSAAVFCLAAKRSG